MARARHLLTTKTLKALAAPGRHADGDGLYVAIDKGGAKRWAFLFTLNGKRREAGFGSWPTVTLDRARELADEARKLVVAGVDPIDAKKAVRKSSTVPTFLKAAEDFLKHKAPSLRNDKHVAQWKTTLGLEPYDLKKVRTERSAHSTYVAALEDFKAKPVDQIDVASVLAVIGPIWHAAPETASRVRGRIEMVLDATRVAGHRSGDNPARWAGNLALLLPARTKISRGHHAAAPFADLPGIVARLRATGGISASALEFLILTAARTGEVIGAAWGEFDMLAKLWTVPGDRMKSGREHRVPLTDRAVAILKAMHSLRSTDAPDAVVFPGAKRGKGLSNMALAKALKRTGADDFTVHGFRSSFRDWCGDATDFPREIAEAALAHAIGDETEAAYRRSDALSKRRKLMVAWSEYIEK